MFPFSGKKKWRQKGADVFVLPEAGHGERFEQVGAAEEAQFQRPRRVLSGQSGADAARPVRSVGVAGAVQSLLHFFVVPRGTPTDIKFTFTSTSR